MPNVIAPMSCRVPVVNSKHLSGKATRRGLRATLVIAMSIATGASARADLRVCNKSHVLVNLAVGANDGEDFATEGWWTVTPGSCATPIRGALKGRYIYLYATDIDAVDVLEGTVSMCVDRGKFRVIGIADCWRRGLMAVNFAEIDTLDARDWTTFLTDVGK
jgi:uncharacterized membrane protein